MRVKVEQIDSAINDTAEGFDKLQLEDKLNIIDVIDDDPAEFARLVREWLNDNIESEAGETICPDCLDNGDIVYLEEVTMPEKVEGVIEGYKTMICRECRWGCE